MKPGSIVEFVLNIDPININAEAIRDIVVPKKNFPYTVREIVQTKYNPNPIVLLEELICGYNIHTGEEAGFGTYAYREIEFPPSLEEEIQEALTREAVQVETF